MAMRKRVMRVCAWLITRVWEVDVDLLSVFVVVTLVWG